MTQGIRPAITSIYDRVPANDELVVMFTDFRFDRLYSSGSGSGPVNVPVQGVGTQADPSSGENYGSDNLLVTMAPVFVGGPRFAFERVENGYEQCPVASAIASGCGESSCSRDTSAFTACRTCSRAPA